jgi:hypothetical protein
VQISKYSDFNYVNGSPKERFEYNHSDEEEKDPLSRREKNKRFAKESRDRKNKYTM